MWPVPGPFSFTVQPPLPPAGSKPTAAEVVEAVRYAKRVRREPAATNEQIRDAVVYEAVVVAAAAAGAMAAPPGQAAGVGAGAAPMQAAAGDASGAALVLPPDTPPWAAYWFNRLDGKLTALQTSFTTLQGDVTALQGDVTTVQGDVAKLLHRTSAAYTSAIANNSAARCSDGWLVPVPHPDTSRLPQGGSFPATVSAMRGMTPKDVDDLLLFYAIPAVGTQSERRHDLALALGCGHVC